MAKIFKPRRGKKSTMAGTKKTTVLSAGEMFIEVPDTGAGTGHSKMKIGDGSTQYSSLPYAMGDTENDKIAFSNDTSGNITTALNKVTSGAALKTMIAALKQAVSLANTSITQLNDESDSIKNSLNNKANIDHWHANMKCRETTHWFSAEWTGNSLQLWIDATNVFDTANFQAGVSTLYNKCTAWGVTPSSNSPTDISIAIDNIANGMREVGRQDVTGNPNGYNLFTAEQYNANYNAGYAAGVAAGQGSVAGSYRLDFRINAHDENVNQWIRYKDQITLNVQSNGSASLGSPSFMNAQIRAEQGEYCNISKVG